MLKFVNSACAANKKEKIKAQLEQGLSLLLLCLKRQG